MNSERKNFGGEKTVNHLDSDKQLEENQAIKSDEDVHEAEAGNIGQLDAKKDELDGPSIDLVGQPSQQDNKEE